MIGVYILGVPASVMALAGISLGVVRLRRPLSQSTLDGPGRLLDAAARRLPDDRREWGAAMTAELAGLEGTASRWRFALGCAFVATFPPRRRGPSTALVVATGTAAALAASLILGRTAPTLRPFAVTLIVTAVALVSIPRRPRSGPGW
jgi:hypothetical protein